MAEWRDFAAAHIVAFDPFRKSLVRTKVAHPILAVTPKRGGVHLNCEWLFRPMNRLDIVDKWKGRILSRPHLVIDGQLKWEIQDVRYFALQCLGEEPAVYESGRHGLFDRCEICGDPDCGAVTAKIKFDDWQVTWSDFHWEVDYAYDERSDAPTYRLVDESEYSFERERYEALMNELLKRRRA